MRVSCELERVEGREEGRAGCGCEAVVWRGAEGEEVDLVRWGGADDGTASVRAQRRDGDREESCHFLWFVSVNFMSLFPNEEDKMRQMGEC